MEQYPLAAFWAYVLLFLLTLPFVFVFPPGGLVVFFLSLFSLPFTVLGYFILRACSDRLPAAPVAEALGPHPGARADVTSDAAAGGSPDARR